MSQKIEIHVHGMTCDGCASAVKRALMKLEGVKEVDVHLEQKKVHVAYDPAHLDAAKIHHTIREAGYEIVG
ncbi:MAG: heavy-metal-associated domain-containing protein [Acetobacter sp.]|nr:heavy-metal-associated domain-containing protein [Acetobacter sp.]MBR2124250.1 heavy-metal-associated domain-containing protein [Acetobacter sp.]